MAILQGFLAPIFEPLLELSPLMAIAIISFAIALIINIVYKLMTDQVLMKALKKEIKDLQTDMKKFAKEPEKVMAIQKKAMERNMKYMAHSMKPTLITLLPLIVIFGWLNANLAYEPINPGEEFTITMEFNKNAVGEAEIILLEGLSLLDDEIKKIDGSATWLMKGDAGEHLVEWHVAGKTYKKDVLISDEQHYADVIKSIKDDNVKQIIINNEKKIVMNLMGWKLGWLGAYIIFSIIFSMITRKVMGLH